LDASLKAGARHASTQLPRPVKFSNLEVTLAFTEVNAMGNTHPIPRQASKAYWAITASCIPRSRVDSVSVVNPFANCVELHVLDVEAGKRAAKNMKYPAAAASGVGPGATAVAAGGTIGPGASFIGGSGMPGYLEEGSVFYVSTVEIEDASRRSFEVAVDDEVVVGVIKIK
jgi:hypothetical protein